MSWDPSQYSKEDVHYRFLRLYSIDLNMARQSLALLSRYRRADVRHAIFRDVVVGYARPFSSNRDHRKRTHELSLRHVPKTIRPLHKELMKLRHQLFAHTDFAARQPSVTRWQGSVKAQFPMSFSNPPYDAWLRRSAEILELLEAVEESIRKELTELEEGCSWNPVAPAT